MSRIRASLNPLQQIRGGQTDLRMPQNVHYCRLPLSRDDMALARLGWTGTPVACRFNDTHDLARRTGQLAFEIPWFPGRIWV